MLDKIISIQDMLGIAIITGLSIKIFQFWKEGKIGNKRPGVNAGQKNSKSKGGQL